MSISRREKTKDPDEPFHLPVKGRFPGLPHQHSIPYSNLRQVCAPSASPAGGDRQVAGSGQERPSAGASAPCFMNLSPLPSWPPHQGSWLGPGTAELWESSQGTCKQERRAHCLLNSLTNDDHLLWEQNVFVCELTFKPRCFKTVISKFPRIQFRGPFLRGGVCEVGG